MVTDSSAVGITPEDNLLKTQMVKERCQVGDVLFHAVCLHRLRPVALTVTTLVEENSAVPHKPVDVPGVLPHRNRPATSGLQYDGEPLADGLIVKANAGAS